MVREEPRETPSLPFTGRVIAHTSAAKLTKRPLRFFVENGCKVPPPDFFGQRVALGRLRADIEPDLYDVCHLQSVAVDTAERTAESWKTLEQADVLPKELKESIGRQILAVATSVK